MNTDDSKTMLVTSEQNLTDVVEIKNEMEEAVMPDAAMPKPTDSTVLQKEQSLNYIGLKEFKSLKRMKYAEKKGQFDKVFVLKNRKTGAIAEIEATTSFQACKFIGWKPKQVVLLETKDIKVDEETDSKAGNNAKNKEQ